MNALQFQKKLLSMQENRMNFGGNDLRIRTT